MLNHLRYFWVLLFVVFLTVPAQAQEKSLTAKESAALEKAKLEEQISYTLGYDIINKLKDVFEINPEYFLKGTKDSFENTPKFTEEQLQYNLMLYQRIARQKQIEQIKKESETNQRLGKEFLDENKKKEGVVTLSSGLQYKVITQGKGVLPKANDTVECHYKGTLIDGTVFDSSYERGKPAVFQVNGVIPGWIEALQKMNVGSKWMLYIPPEMAYGDRGAGSVIKPGSTLVFEVEVLSVVE